MTLSGTSDATDGLRARTARSSPQTDEIPRPAVPLSDGLGGLCGLVIAFIIVLILKPPVMVAVWFVLLATAVPMLRSELRRAPAPSPDPRNRGAASPLLWVVGLVLATAPFALVHAQGMGLAAWGAAWLVAAPAFLLRFLLEIRRNGAPSAGFPAAVGRVLARPRLEAFRALVPDARLWVLKAFFIPLYGLSLYVLMRLTTESDVGSPTGLLVLAVVFAYTIDLAFGLSGYLFANNELAPTLRSTQHRLLGWIVCLLCYGPIVVHWPAFEQVVHREIGWPDMLSAEPLALAGGVSMLALLVIYISATVCFGLRFSNLSNRGVITTGPYRLMKHPAYFAHAANAWVICFLLVPAVGIEMGLSQWLVPIAFTVLYRLRAVTEEQHMSEDPAYRDYADWIARHGVLARLRRTVRLG